MWSCDRSTQ